MTSTKSIIADLQQAEKLAYGVEDQHYRLSQLIGYHGGAGDSMGSTECSSNEGGAVYSESLSNDLDIIFHYVSTISTKLNALLDDQCQLRCVFDDLMGTSDKPVQCATDKNLRVKDSSASRVR